MYYTTENIRQKFFEFFKKKNHKIYPGSSLTINDDPSLLFTNAGMNQFKNIFLGYQTPKYKKIASLQHCLRTGGKHNDLNNVGHTSRHHTFFEMLGNFSFGSYFKEKAITYAWELLTSKKWFNINAEKILVTVYANDYETYKIWKNIIGIAKDKIILMQDKKKKLYTSENFWMMGKYGVCGPCTEIFYDQCKNNIQKNFQKNKKKYKNRFIEIWNIVFIEYNKLPNNTFQKLKTPSVDTGMGLERIATILQNVKSNYEIDIFKKIIQKIKTLKTIKKKNDRAIQVIADHIRSSAFIIANNVLPSNEHRGYILRKIIRRAVRYGRSLGIKKCFFYKLVPILIKVMGSSNAILINKQKKIENILKNEEINFSQTLKKGLKILNKEIKNTKNKILDGKIVFYLYDTLGFPIDLTKNICLENNIKIDNDGLKKQIEKNKSSIKKKMITNQEIIIIPNIKQTKFAGYNIFKTKSIVQSIYRENTLTKKIKKNEKGKIIIEKTPFYAESGGQIGDSGKIYSKNGIFKVYNTKKYGNFFIHIGKIKSGKIKTHDKIIAEINIKKRKLIEKNHTSIHLLHSGLRKILGKHISQKGSLINDKKIRFDFSHYKPLTLKQIYKIEKFVNNIIHKNIKIKSFFIKFKEAKEKKIRFLPNKIYKKKVRVISIKNFSNELCGGTHVKKTGKIIIFKILNEKNVSSGIRRIKAVTYKEALKKNFKTEKKIQKLKQITKSKNSNLIQKIKNIIQYQKKILKENKEIQKKYILLIAKKISNNDIKICKIHFIFKILKNEEIKYFRSIIDILQKKFPSIIIILINISKKNYLIIKISKNLPLKIKANRMIKKIFKIIPGKGGGNKYISEGILNSEKNLINKIHKVKKKIIKMVKKNK
ncbi:Alanine--tRNA ligase [Buchnera aphidicola (Sipha maydis)]|uniref:alanine--tRNA ligase n=1 Tax=Buchnera aphidicola TaxID=9 RepID=UPI003464CB7F